MVLQHQAAMSRKYKGHSPVLIDIPYTMRSENPSCNVLYYYALAVDFQILGKS